MRVNPGHDIGHDLLVFGADLVERALVDRHETHRVDQRHLGDVLDLGVPLQDERADRRHRDDIDQTRLQARQHVGQRQRNR